MAGRISGGGEDRSRGGSGRSGQDGGGEGGIGEQLAEANRELRSRYLNNL